MSKFRAFILGMREFRTDLTSAVDETEAYDAGREFAHRVTFRAWDEAAR